MLPAAAGHEQCAGEDEKEGRGFRGDAVDYIVLEISYRHCSIGTEKEIVTGHKSTTYGGLISLRVKAQQFAGRYVLNVEIGSPNRPPRTES